MLTKGVFILAAKRTPFGTFGGALKGLTATDLAAEASKAALKSTLLASSAVDHVVFGNVAQTSSNAPYLARHAALRAGVPESVPAVTVNRLCGSGFESIINAAQLIQLGEAGTVLCGGAESMSQAPLSVYGQDVRWGTGLGTNLQLTDTLWAALTDSHANLPMAMTAEKLGAQYGITREECDEFALRSQTAWAAAHDEGVFEAELAPLEVAARRGKKVAFEADEHPRPGTTLEGLAKLKPVFKVDGLVSAGNASGICDGAAALVVASEDVVSGRRVAEPLARIVAYHVVGVDPSIMGIGPAPAIRGALAKAGLSLDDMDLVEVNEAFAAQYLAVEKELGLDRERCNADGGAIALGHPLAASGARIMTHLTHRLIATGGRYAVGSACIGGGQGIAVIIENVKGKE